LVADGHANRQGIIITTIISNGATEKNRIGATMATLHMEGTGSTSGYMTESLDWAEKAIGKPQWGRTSTLSASPPPGKAAAVLRLRTMARNGRVKTIGISTSEARRVCLWWNDAAMDDEWGSQRGGAQGSGVLLRRRPEVSRWS
jgi:hypothetical protein